MQDTGDSPVSAPTSPNHQYHEQSPIILTPGCTFAPATDLNAVLFDADKKTVLLLKNDEEVEIISGESFTGTGVRIGHKGAVRDAKLSQNGHFIGVLRSAKVLEIMRIGADEKAIALQEVLRDGSSSEAILGFEWTHPGELLVINSYGPELYQYSEPNGIFTRRKSKRFIINWYTYWPDYHILITSVGALDLKLFHVKVDTNLDQLPALHVSPKGKADTLRGQTSRKQFSVVGLYGRVYCTFIDLTTDVPILLLYRISKSALSCQATLTLESKGNFIINTVDNLLVVHNLTRKHALLFDLKETSSQPIIQPKRVSLEEKEDLDCEWQACTPDKVLVPSRGILYNLRLNINAICHHLRTHLKDLDVLVFLLRRTADIAPTTMDIIKDMIRSRTDPSVIRQVFDLLNSHNDNLPRTLRRIIREASSESVNSFVSSTGVGSIQPASSTSKADSQLSRIGWTRPSIASISNEKGNTLGQEQLYANVFSILAVDSSVPLRYITTCLLEYISSLSQCQTVAPYFHELLAETLVRDRRFSELHQYVQYNVVQDSVVVSRLLLRNHGAYDPYKQIGLDMLKRLNAHEEIVDILVSRGQVVDALRYAVSRNCLPKISVTNLLEAALASGDKTLFLNTFKCLEEHGLISSNITNEHREMGVAPGGASRYVSVFREMWGEVVEMDSLIDM